MQWTVLFATEATGMQEKCLGFLHNLLENYKDRIEDADVFLPLECPGADKLLVRLVREELPQDVIESMSNPAKRGFFLQLDDDPVHTTLSGQWNADDIRSKVKNILPALFDHALASPWGGEGRKGHLPRQDDGIAAHPETVRQGNRHKVNEIMAIIAKANNNNLKKGITL